MTEEISGLKVRMPGSDAIKLAEKQASFHKSKVDRYLSAKSSIGLATEGESRGSFDPERDLNGKIRDHEGKALYFEALAKYIIPDATYLLSQDEVKLLLGLGLY